MEVFNNKGSTTISAVIALPIVILSFISIVMMVVFLFQEVEKTKELQLSLRSYVGEETKTVIYNHCSINNFKNERVGINKVAIGEVKINEKGNLILRKYSKEIRERNYLVDEKKIIFYTDFIKSS